MRDTEPQRGYVFSTRMGGVVRPPLQRFPDSAVSVISPPVLPDFVRSHSLNIIGASTSHL
jgi:hypothetical protein